MNPPDIEIISLRDHPAFADVCAAWSYGQWSSQTGRITLEQAVARYRATAAAAPGTLPATWVAVIDGRPAGMISLKENDHPDRTDINPWLASLFVHPVYRRRGIAARLIAQCEAAARTEYGIEKLYLFTPDMTALYERAGWTVIGTVRDPAGLHPGGDALMMKELG